MRETVRGTLIPMSQVKLGEQYFCQVNPDDIKKLQKSYKLDGQLLTDPIILFKLDDNKYKVLGGNHCFAAWSNE